MHKKIIAIVFAVLLLGYLVNYYNRPIFYAYAQQYTVYLGDNSSNAKIRQVDRLGCTLSMNKYGESCVVDGQEFDLDEFVKEFDAEQVLVEQIDSGVNYYFYSPSVKYLQSINGQRVNLQVFISENRVVLGSPLIYGGY